jgi:hypothetical protein
MEAGHFYPGPLGLPTTTPPASAIAVAREKWRRMDAATGPDIFDPVTTSDWRWCGALFEAAFAAWLREQRIPYDRHGGVDRLPDFVVAGISVAAKVRALRWERVQRQGVDLAAVRFFWPLAQSVPSTVVWGIYDPDSTEVSVAGFSDKATVLGGVVVRKGDEIVPGVEALADNLAVRFDSLRSPIAWLQDVYVAELQHAV